MTRSFSEKMTGDTVDQEIILLSETTGLETDQVESLLKGFEGFDKEGTESINETSMQMILKSMGVKSDRSDLHNAAMVLDEFGTGQFTFAQFCSVSRKTLSQKLIQKYY